MNGQQALDNIRQSQRLLEAVLSDNNVLLDILDEAERRVTAADTKYKALRRFLGSAVLGELRRMVRQFHLCLISLQAQSKLFQARGADG